MVNAVNNNFVVIGQDKNTQKFYWQERTNNDGKPGKIDGIMGDGCGDVRGLVNEYVAKGYTPEHILYNGQPVTDVFTKVNDENGNVSFQGH